MSPVFATPEIITRGFAPEAYERLRAAGLSPVLSRIYAGRGVSSREQLEHTLARLLPPDPMR